MSGNTDKFTISNKISTSNSSNSNLNLKPINKLKELTLENLELNSTKRTLAEHSPSNLLKRIKIIEILSNKKINNLIEFKNNLKELNFNNYLELLEERFYQNFCSYPACQSNKNSLIKYSTFISQNQNNKKLKLKGGNLYSSNNNETSGEYCSKQCENRSEWIKNLLLNNNNNNNNNQEIELLEEIEIRRNNFTNATTTLTSNVNEDEHTFIEEESTASKFIIKENETPSEPPLAPTKSIDFERILSTSSSSSSSSNTPLSLSRGPRLPTTSSSFSSTKESSSLLPFSTQSLSKTLLKANATLTSSSSSNNSNYSSSSGNSKNNEPRFITEPIMVDQQGREIDWSREELELGLDAGGGEETEEERIMMEDALEIRRVLREEGLLV